jgi:hypothetical protein
MTEQEAFEAQERNHGGGVGSYMPNRPRPTWKEWFSLLPLAGVLLGGLVGSIGCMVLAAWKAVDILCWIVGKVL